jgi:hypothetical protein
MTKIVNQRPLDGAVGDHNTGHNDDADQAV